MRKFISICVVSVFCLTGCVGSKQPQQNVNYCDDLYVKGEIAKEIIDIENQSKDEETRLKNIFCENNMIVVQIDINVDRTEKTLLKASKKDFDEILANDLGELYCTNKDYEFYRKRNMPIKWQYFFKDEKEPYGEGIVNNDICR